MKRGTVYALLGVVIVAAIAKHSDTVERDQSSSPAAAAARDASSVSCLSRRPTHPGVVHIDADLDGEPIYGSGIALTPSGDILTNDHVIRGTTGICVTTMDRDYLATVVTTDPVHDVALLRLTGGAGLAPVEIAGTRGVIGQRASILGNGGDRPDSAEVTDLGVTAHVSDGFRGTSHRLTGLIEVGAPVPAGDSGGPLLNASDQVIGMDVARTDDSGFAIPIHDALTYVGTTHTERD